MIFVKESDLVENFNNKKCSTDCYKFRKEAITKINKLKKSQLGARRKRLLGLYSGRCFNIIKEYLNTGELNETRLAELTIIANDLKKWSK